jgi:hypothetical protein
MDRLANLDLIRLFDFYLAAMFVIGSVRRYALYRTTVGIALNFPNRWPHLFNLMKSHRAILLTWRTFLPSIMTLLIWGCHTLASRLIWHPAELTIRDLAGHWIPLLIVAPLGCAMVALDTYFLIVVGVVDRPMVEAYFDQAEHWLTSWQAPVVKAFTLGFINPRRMVNDEVQKALVAAGDLLERSLYLTSLQMGLRIAFGLSLWVAWAFWGQSAPAIPLPDIGATVSSFLLSCR